MSDAVIDEYISDIEDIKGDWLAMAMYLWPWGEEGTLLEKYPDGPRQWQANILNGISAGIIDVSEAMQIAVASGHGIGKSALVAMIVLIGMHEPLTRGVITAGTDTQQKTKTQPEIQKRYNLMLTRDWYACDATKIYHKSNEKNWRIDLIPWSEKNPEAFAGLHNVGNRIIIVFDEASQIAPIIWETIRGALTDEDTEILWCAFGNPTRNTGEFRMCFGRNRKRWINFQIDSRQVPGTNVGQIGQWEEDYGEDSDFFRVRVRGVFPRAGSMQLIASDLVEAARARTVEATRADAVVIGVDVARGGEDDSVIAIRQGNDAKSRPWKRYDTRDLMTLASEVARIAREIRADAIFIDETGLGAGVYDRVIQLRLPEGCQVYGINFAAAPDMAFTDDQIKVANKRAEMWWNMARAMKRLAIPDEQQIEDDLIGIEYGYNGQNAIQMEKKSDMKKRGLSSPDNGDALALTFAYAVAPVRAGREDQQKRRERAARSRNNRTGY